MLTIFAVPKPFDQLSATIQHNAILSWKSLAPSCEIILLGDEQGVAEFAREHRLRHIPKIECNSFGTPLISSVFDLAKTSASFNRLAYVNADIILPDNFAAAVDAISFRNYLLIGRRTCVTIDQPIEFENDQWYKYLMHWATETGHLDSAWGMDYFVFPREMWDEIPPFAIGRFGWDNWLVYNTLCRRIPVVDLTRAVTVLHQDHDYKTTAGFDPRNWKSDEISNNLKLAGKGVDYGVRQSGWRLERQTSAAHERESYRIVANPERHLASIEAYVRRCRRQIGSIRRSVFGRFRRAA